MRKSRRENPFPIDIPDRYERIFLGRNRCFGKTFSDRQLERSRVSATSVIQRFYLLSRDGFHRSFHRLELLVCGLAEELQTLGESCAVIFGVALVFIQRGRLREKWFSAEFNKSLLGLVLE